MKKLMLVTMMLVVGLVLVLDANATDPNFDTKTGIVFMPRVTIDHKDAYTDVELLLNPDNTYEILAATPENEDKIYAIGKRGPAGGIVFYITDGGKHGLEAAPEDQAVIATWGCFSKIIVGADGFDVGTGEQNTIDILEQCNVPGIAADIAGNYTLEDYIDWFLPSWQELNFLYFQRAVVGGFENANYWSSTQFSTFDAWFQSFENGGQSTSTKNSGYRVRAIRSF